MSSAVIGLSQKRENATFTKLAIMGAAVGLAIVGVVFTSFNPMWIAGSLGISAAAASQIVAAIKAGKNATLVVAAVAGFGVASAITWTIGLIVFTWALEPAVV